MRTIEGGSRKKSPFKNMELGNPLVSIITVVYNGASGIEETVVSVKERLTDDIEYIIIDGGSSDGTLDVIRKHEASIDYWISEPDRGIYDAINKGIKISNGYFFFVLNLGDKLIELPHAELKEAKEKGGDVILFNVLLSNGKVISSKIDYRTRFGNTIHHQGAFYKRSLNITYDLTYRVYSDFDLNQKLFLQRKKFMKFNKVVSSHSLSGISNDRKYRSEYFSVIRKNFGLVWVIIGFLYIWQGEMRIKFKNLLGFKAATNILSE
jgi:glycosyltransferase involved in cell wall biosynthesis